MIFVFDQIINGRPYPNLGTVDAKPGTPAWRTFSTTPPYVEPFTLYDYCIGEGIEVHGRTLDQLGGTPAWYPIQFTFFDHDVDYISLIPDEIVFRVKTGQIKLLFYYSEGDNPKQIQDKLAWCCADRGIALSQIKIVSANSAADLESNMVWFADDEILYRRRNRTEPEQWKDNKDYPYTMLVRTHKHWRALTASTIIGRIGNGIVGYNTVEIDPAANQESPLELTDERQQRIQKFVDAGPYSADSLNSDQHNSYETHVPEHFNNSYLNIILETHLDADGSLGAFLTEKTFKPIKHAQPFVIVGCVNSLAALKKLGYRTFDNVIDPSYDSIVDNEQRWRKVIETLDKINAVGFDKIAKQCQEDCLHNQELFLSSKKERLNTLLERIQQ